jgi:DNA-binding MarR family transcriptional regulator
MNASPDIASLALELSRLLRRRMSEDGSFGGLSLLRCHALTWIREHDRITMSDFAEGMRISPSAATTFVDRLCRDGWVAREPDPANRKLVHLRVTPAGEQALAEHALEKRAFLDKALMLIPDADRNHLQRILIQLVQVLDPPSRS